MGIVRVFLFCFKIVSKLSDQGSPSGKGQVVGVEV